ncbi:PepSY-associated TM helix domain-containing protein [Hymenobacter latericus]|uniref:PepSY-associated TM helix domain-containing protein n=1 Tax=Hymenobacter sp. YIM 151858-1 TaxID=2987688 RepID=UPI002226ABD5|nr:PepSY-associated TM helix domain-containing protein [Hymenobacter sp. YIM 151858-1]UYZ60607.1 PepSY domain-containing protein [Hymenobacter sp. YIM 151858-1]
MNLKRRLFSLHSWLGLVCGAFMLVFFCTGALMVFREELNKQLHPELFRVAVGERRLSYDELYRRAKAAEPAAQFYSFRHVPQAPNEALEIRIYEKQEPGRLFVNPYTGQVLGKSFGSFTDQLIILHYSFFLGKLGEALAGTFAIALLGSVLTGFVVYRKHLLDALLLRTPIRWKNWRTASSGLHRVLGSWALLFNVVLAGSGLWMSWDAFDLKKIFADDKEKKEKALPAVAANLDALIAEAQRQEPGLELVRVNFPRKPDAPVTVLGRAPGSAWLWGRTASKVEFSNQAGAAQLKKVFRERDLRPAERFDFALRTLHYGQYGGLAIKIIYSLLALSSAVITLTGFLLWWRRRRPARRPAPVRRQAAVSA